MKQCSITYIGHATALIKLNDLNFLTDPSFRGSAGIYGKRFVPPGIEFEKLPKIDAILISHNHIDHLDRPTLKMFPKDTPILISNGLEKHITKLGFKKVTGLNWWEEIKISEIKITCVPAKHLLNFSKPSGFIFEANRTIYFSGDTRTFKGMSEIGNRFKIDLAILLIEEGRFKKIIPNIFQKFGHMLVHEVPEIIEMLQAKKAIPMHWGTFRNPGTSTIHQFKKVVKEKKFEDKVEVIEIGEIYKF